ncbi:MAG: rod shape-determining protein MreD [Legionellales bacterium]|nr:MAG: rod shape-determining protein MreD [Legionellales bacterium]
MRTILAITISLWFAVVCVLAPKTQLAWLHTDWVMLVLIFWLLAAPRYTGVLVAFAVGIVLDVLLDLTLGQYALTFVVITYLVDLLRMRMQLFMLWQYSIALIILINVGNIVLFATHFFINNNFDAWLYFSTVVSSYCCYPLVHLVLSRIRYAYVRN